MGKSADERKPRPSIRQNVMAAHSFAGAPPIPKEPNDYRVLILINQQDPFLGLS